MENNQKQVVSMPQDAFVSKIKELCETGKRKEAIAAIEEEQRRLRTYAVCGQLVPNIQALQVLKVKICASSFGKSLSESFPKITQIVLDMKLLSWVSNTVVKPFETKHPIYAKAVKVGIVGVGLTCKLIMNKDGVRTKLMDVCKDSIKLATETSKLVVQKAKEIVSHPFSTVKKGLTLFGRALMKAKEKVFSGAGSKTSVGQLIDIAGRA